MFLLIREHECGYYWQVSSRDKKSQKYNLFERIPGINGRFENVLAQI